MNSIIASTSTLYGSTFLAYLQDPLQVLFKGVEELIFIPYARPGGISHDAYTQKAQEGLSPLNIKVRGLHEFNDPKQALAKAQALFTGGGNTFVLLNQLYQQDLLSTLKKAILEGTPYLGTSAGSNICGKSIMTTNDMPIVYPPSFESMGILPFNLNPHYLDPDPNSTHNGELRETRIQEYHAYNTPAVVGLREGSWIRLEGNECRLQGPLSARIFQAGKQPYELEAGASLAGLANI